MQTLSPPSSRLSKYTNIPFEIFVITCTVLPFFLLAYFYPALSERVPLFMQLNGEVAVWGEKNWLSVFRVPLMAVVTQVVCLLMKYGVLQYESVLQIDRTDEYERLHNQYIAVNAGFWDWLRFLVAIKMSAASLDTIFLSMERFKFLSRPAFVITFIVAILSIAGAVFYGYRFLVARRKLRDKFGEATTQRSADTARVYGGIFYFNPTDSALFISKYGFNFGNKWAWVFVSCIIAYSLLVFLPTRALG